MNQISNTRLYNLARKWLSGTISDDEIIEFDQWYNSFDDTKGFFHNEIDKSSLEELLRTRIFQRAELTAPLAKKKKWFLKPVFKWGSAAAIVLLTFSIAYLYDQPNHETQKVGANKQLNLDVAPGWNKASLTLSDGRRLNLDGEGTGELVNETGIKIIKKDDGTIFYDCREQKAKSHLVSKPTYNRLETPAGGQYKLILPDGSIVWLNSASSLKYPTTFDGEKRIVELTGEGYFEVATNKEQPFQVITAKQELEVLGTKFNINDYEESTKTTLIQGGVRIAKLHDGPDRRRKHHVVLKPGEQAVLSDDIRLEVADMEEVLAWKNGDFIFKNESITQVMNEIARWYNIKVDYQGRNEQVRFGGYVSKSRNISAVLKMLESTGKVTFKIHPEIGKDGERRVTVIFI